MAMVPFPFIFKARALSKSWQARFSPISSLDDGEDKRFAISFQKQVGERSVSWTTFCPVYWHRKHKKVSAYDRASRNWRRIPWLPFVPNGAFGRADVQMAGALVLVEMEAGELCVANILTGGWKRLPARSTVEVRGPNETKLVCGAGLRPHETKLVCGTSLEFYNVILFYGTLGFNFLAHIYDSKSNTWSFKNVVAPREYWFVAEHSAYLDGVLYMSAYYESSGLLKVLAFNIKAETLEELEMPSIHRLTNAELLICGGSVWIVAYDNRMRSDHLRIQKVDVAGGSLKVCEGAPAFGLKKISILSRPVTDGNRILWKASRRSVLEYNAVEDVWSILPSHGQLNYGWESSPFQPGLNPLVEV